MAVKKNRDFEVTWQCGECGKWNFSEATHCWKCHEPKCPEKPKSRKNRSKKELANAQ